MWRSVVRRAASHRIVGTRFVQQQQRRTKYAVVRHGQAYHDAMEGLHGQQLALAQKEGEGKDDPDFDPFLEEEMEEVRKIEEAQAAHAAAHGGAEEDDDDDVEGDDEQDFGEPEEDDESDSEEQTDTGNYEITPDHSVAPRYFETFQQKVYKSDGSLRRNKSELAILRAGAPAGGLVAIIALAGTQYKVTTDDVLIVNKLNPVSKYCVGSIHTLTSEVLLVTCTSLTLVGMPSVDGAEVDVMVEEVTKDKKVIVFKKMGKGPGRKNGHRREVTMLRILDIRLPEALANEDYMERPEPAPLVAVD